MNKAERLAENAVGDTVTEGVLLGGVRYYPPVLDFLNDQEQPHHIALLTTKADLRVEIAGRQNKWSTYNAALVASENFVRIVATNPNTTDLNIVVPYEIVTEFKIYDSGSRRNFGFWVENENMGYGHTEAKSADHTLLDVTAEFIDNMSDEVHMFGDSDEKPMNELEQQHANGKISDAEYVIRRKNL